MTINRGRDLRMSNNLCSGPGTSSTTSPQGKSNKMGRALLGVTTLAVLLTTVRSQYCHSDTVGTSGDSKVSEEFEIPANVVDYQFQVPADCPGVLTGVSASGCYPYDWSLVITTQPTAVVHVHRDASPSVLRLAVDLHCKQYSSDGLAVKPNVHNAARRSAVESSGNKDATWELTAEDVTDEDVTSENATSEDKTSENKTSENVTDENVTSEDATRENSTSEKVQSRKKRSANKQKQVVNLTSENLTSEDETAENATSEKVKSKKSKVKKDGKKKVVSKSSVVKNKDDKDRQRRAAESIYLDVPSTSEEQGTNNDNDVTQEQDVNATI